MYLGQNKTRLLDAAAENVMLHPYLLGLVKKTF
jgi:hypothetical protein